MSTPTFSEQEPLADRTRWFQEEVHAHDSSLKAYLRGSFPAVHDVDDVVQESYLRIWKARGRQPIRCVRGFLFRIARNVALNLVNRQRISPIEAGQDWTLLQVAEEQPNAAATACTRDELRLLAQAIDALPEPCREIVILRRIQNISQKEIAARLGLSEESVEIHVVRGVKRCWEYLRRRGVRFEHEAQR